MLRSHDEKRARELIQVALSRLALNLELVRAMRKNDPGKQAITWLVRSQTILKCAWIGQELNMGSRVSIYQATRSSSPAPQDPKKWQLRHLLEDLTI